MTNPLTRDYDLQQVAQALNMSSRWVRDQAKAGAEHQRYGNKIMFTAEQVEKLRARHTKRPVTESVTTGRGRKKSSAP